MAVSNQIPRQRYDPTLSCHSLLDRVPRSLVPAPGVGECFGRERRHVDWLRRGSENGRLRDNARGRLVAPHRGRTACQPHNSRLHCRACGCCSPRKTSRPSATHSVGHAKNPTSHRYVAIAALEAARLGDGHQWFVRFASGVPAVARQPQASVSWRAIHSSFGWVVAVIVRLVGAILIEQNHGRMGRSACPLHDTGNNRSIER
jgi:hypothetical protein